MKKKFLIMVLLIMSTGANAETLEVKKSSKKTKISIPGTLNTPNANPFPKGKVVVALKSQLFENDKLYSGSSEVDNSEKKRNEIFNNVLVLRYGISDRFSIKANAPIVNKELHMTKTKANETIIENSGMGDIKTFLGYNLKSEKKGDNYSALLELGIVLPTGKTDKDFNINTSRGVTVSRKPYGMQLGDGSVDGIVQMTLSKTINRSRIDFSANYVMNTEGDNNLEYGDSFGLNMAYINKINNLTALYAELNSSYSEKNKVDGIKEENSGGTQIYVTPGITFNLLKKLSLAGGIQIPVYRNLNGEQIVSDYRIVTKISYNVK